MSRTTATTTKWVVTDCTFVVYADHKTACVEFVTRLCGSAEQVFTHCDQAVFRDRRRRVVILLDERHIGSTMAWFGPSGPFLWVRGCVVRERLAVSALNVGSAACLPLWEQAHSVGLQRVEIVRAVAPRPEPNMLVEAQWVFKLCCGAAVCGVALTLCIAIVAIFIWLLQYIILA
jgi:hypothetical protein